MSEPPRRCVNGMGVLPEPVIEEVLELWVRGQDCETIWSSPGLMHA